MNNKCSYYDDTYKFVDEAVIESAHRDDKGSYILLDHTLFYPQGGGQPSDQGQLQLIDTTHILILSAKMIDGEIRHYTDQDCSRFAGQQVICNLDKEKRLFHSKLHTAGHLISHVLENLYPSFKATKGHHFPGECYVEFITDNNPTNIDLELLKREIAAVIPQDLQIQSLFVTDEQFRELCSDIAIPTNRDRSIRLVKIGNFPYHACGGTHVKSTSELQGLEIIKIKLKGSSLKVYYSIKD